MPCSGCGQALRGTRARETPSKELHHTSSPAPGTRWDPNPSLWGIILQLFFSPFSSVTESLL